MMAEPKVLSSSQRNTLRSELAREDLSIYNVVRLARKEVAEGQYSCRPCQPSISIVKETKNARMRRMDR